MRISVITAALPSRFDLLAQACKSVRAQTLPAVEHLIGIDYARRGTSAVRNDLLRASTGDWVAVLDDDDVLLPNHLATLAKAAQESPDSDIVYSYCRVEGRPGWTPNRPFDAAELERGNYIPATTIIRRALLDTLGGWQDSRNCPNGWEDWDLWLRALDHEAQFVCAPVETWVYRFHGRNKTYLGEAAAA